jgi:hypothetical protein
LWAKYKLTILNISNNNIYNESDIDSPLRYSTNSNNDNDFSERSYYTTLKNINNFRCGDYNDRLNPNKLDKKFKKNLMKTTPEQVNLIITTKKY